VKTVFGFDQPEQNMFAGHDIRWKCNKASFIGTVVSLLVGVGQGPYHLLILCLYCLQSTDDAGSSSQDACDAGIPRRGPRLGLLPGAIRHLLAVVGGPSYSVSVDIPDKVPEAKGVAVNLVEECRLRIDRAF